MWGQWRQYNDSTAYIYGVWKLTRREIYSIHSILSFLFNCLTIRWLCRNGHDMWIYIFFNFKALSPSCEKGLYLLHVLSVCIEHVGSSWTDFRVNLFWRGFTKICQTNQIRLKSERKQARYVKTNIYLCPPWLLALPWLSSVIIDSSFVCSWGRLFQDIRVQ
jgi:hypothetical protein